MPPRSDLLVFARTAVLMGLVYAVLGRLVLEAGSFGTSAGLTFWPGAGLAIGLLLRTSRRSWPALLLGVFVGEVTIDLLIPVSLSTSLCWGLADTAEPLLGALLITSRGRAPTLAGARSVLRFLARGVVLAPLLGALIGATSTWLTDVDSFWPTFPRWWVGDAVGVLAVAPALFTQRRPDLHRASQAESWWITFGMAALIGLVLVPWPGGVWDQGLPYLLAPALVGVALRLGPQSSAIALALTAITVNTVTSAGVGPFARYGTHDGLVVAQVCIAAAAFALLTVSAMNHDLVSMEKVQELLRAQALQDSLTGLANRRLLLDRLALALDGLRRSRATVAVLFVDLDGFKKLNDTHGHAAGDAALIEIARRLRRCVRPADTVARVGGDEFAIVLPEVPGVAAAEELAERVAATLNRPFLWQDDQVHLAASVGYASTTDPDHPVDELMNHADKAMYGIKAARRG